MSNSLPIVHSEQPMTEANHFALLVRQAEVLSKSQILPAAYRHKSADIIAAGLAGRTFGWDVMTSLNNYHVIEGRASLRPEAMLGLVRRAGHSVKVRFFDEAQGVRVAEATGRRVDNADEHTARFSTIDADAAGLIGKKNWKQYEDAMLQWRAVSALCRVLFPDVVMGAGYVPEELGAPAEVYEDPLADPVVSIADGKRRLLAACGGDRELARRIWEAWAVDNAEAAGIKESDVSNLIETAEFQLGDIIDAEEDEAIQEGNQD